MKNALIVCLLIVPVFGVMWSCCVVSGQASRTEGAFA